MSRCNLETNCHGAGKCCLECNELCFCNHVCCILDKNKTRAQLEEQMKNCDWFEENQLVNIVNNTWIMNRFMNKN